MDQIKAIIAKNIAALRTERGMTQLELAEQLHYTDKAVSKWERGESAPEIGTLAALARFFGVTLDWLIEEEHASPPPQAAACAADLAEKRRKNRVLVTCLSVLLVWLIATIAFVLIDILAPAAIRHWILFLYAVPVSCVVWLVFNSVWFSTRRNYAIISLLIWSLLCAVHVHFLMYGANVWQLYCLGVPGQLIVIAWSRLQFNE